jgi:hypothetical protein
MAFQQQQPFAPQASQRAAITGSNRVLAATSLNPQGTRNQSGVQQPTYTSTNLARDAGLIDPFLDFAQQNQGPVTAESRLSRAQRDNAELAARSTFGGITPQFIDQFGQFVNQQAGRNGGARNGAGFGRSQRQGFQQQQQRGADVGGLVGGPGAFYGRAGNENLMDLAAYEEEQGGAFGGSILQPATQQGQFGTQQGQFGTQQSAFGAQQGAFGTQQGQFAPPTRLEDLQAQQAGLQARLQAATGGVGGAAQGLGATAPFAARYRHNSSDGLGGQAYAGAYGNNNGRRNSVGFGRQAANMNPFASQSFTGRNVNGNQNNGFGAQSFAGQYGNQNGRSNFARQYAAGNQSGRSNFAAQYAGGGQNGRNNFAGQYGGGNQNGGIGAEFRRSQNVNFASQYANGMQQGSRQRRASLGVGNGYF